MKHVKPLNKSAKKQSSAQPDVFGYACSICCTVWAPGWEVDQYNEPDPCPWLSDLSLCWATCYWTGQVPDDATYPDWMDDCSVIFEDWVRLCVVPD